MARIRTECEVVVPETARVHVFEKTTVLEGRGPVETPPVDYASGPSLWKHDPTAPPVDFFFVISAPGQNMFYFPNLATEMMIPQRTYDATHRSQVLLKGGGRGAPLELTDRNQLGTGHVEQLIVKFLSDHASRMVKKQGMAFMQPTEAPRANPLTNDRQRLQPLPKGMTAGRKRSHRKKRSRRHSKRSFRTRRR